MRRTSKEINLESNVDPLLTARRMLAQVNSSHGPLQENTIHQYRIVVKRARYIAELAPKSAEVTEFIAQMKRLQDAIGDWHDWHSLTQTAAAELGTVHYSSLVAALRNVTGGKFRRAAASLSNSLTAHPPRRPIPTSISQREKKAVPAVGARDTSAA